MNPDNINKAAYRIVSLMNLTLDMQPDVVNTLNRMADNITERKFGGDPDLEYLYLNLAKTGFCLSYIKNNFGKDLGIILGCNVNSNYLEITFHTTANNAVVRHFDTTSLANSFTEYLVQNLPYFAPLFSGQDIQLAKLQKQTTAQDNSKPV